jgi:hypothetical protein
VSYLTAPLAGSILLELGLVKSYLIQPSSLTDRSTVLSLFDQAEKFTRLSPINNGLAIRYDSGRYLTARGEGLIVLKRFEDAEEILDEAGENTSPDLTRRQLFIDLQKVNLYVQQKEYATAIALAREAAGKAKGLGSLYSFNSLETITNPIFESNYSRSDDAIELSQFINKAKKKLV